MRAEALILNLNDDCLEEICRNLTEHDQLNFALTCERFYFVFKLLSKVKYANLNTSMFSNWQKCDVEMFLRIVGSEIKTLKLDRYAHGYKMLAWYCTNVENLKFQTDSCKNSILKMIKYMPLLQNVDATNADISNEFIKSLVALNHLRNLNIAENYNITGKTIHLLSGLEKLTLRACKNVTSWHFINICKNLKLLQYLDIRDCQFLKTEDYNHIYLYLSQLETLKLSTTTENFNCLARLPQLKRLEINDPDDCSLAVEFFKDLAMFQAENLEELKLDVLTVNMEIVSLVAELKKLQVLFVNEIQAGMIPLFSNLTELKEITCINGYCITDDHLLYILEKCLKLKFIKIEYRSALSPNFYNKVKKLLQEQLNHNLRTERVHISSCNAMFKRLMEDFSNVLKVTYITGYHGSIRDSSSDSEYSYSDLSYVSYDSDF